MKKAFFLANILFFPFISFSQKDLEIVLQNTNVAILDSLATAWSLEAQNAKALAITQAQLNGWPVRREMPDGSVMELMRLDENGDPVYYATSNIIAAATTRTNKVHTGGSAGLNLNGYGMYVGEWDGGAVRIAHEQLSGRVTQVDGASNIDNHATHVAGTLIGDGIGVHPYAYFAKGMAHQGLLAAHDWFSDEAEMATAGANGLLVSNHSYGSNSGYYYDSSPNGVNLWTWWGGSAQFNSTGQDPKFGKYNSSARNWDIIAVNAPYYLIVKAAANERDDNPVPGDQIRNGISGSYINYNTAIHPLGDGLRDNGYDILPDISNAKNILTVGAVDDLVTYTGAGSVIMSEFSSWGPTDDGRIKPDICGNGVEVWSSIGTGNTNYDSYSGTSMASPNVAGSAILLQEHYRNTHGLNNYMRSATLKGLIIHTADEAGATPGPDYRFGWGLMNTEKAAQVITEDINNPLTIIEDVLYPNGTVSYNVKTDGLQPLIVTLCWTDPAATASSSSSVDDPGIKLINDLDINLTLGGSTFYPYVLNPASPSSAATTGDNDRDNVEKIYLGTPAAGTYTLVLNHEGTMTGSGQNFSLIVTGGTPSFTNPTTCQVAIPLLDNTCGSAVKFPISVTTAPGTQLGNNVVLKEAKVIIRHTWDEDMTMRLYSPNNTMVELTSGNGGSGDNYGDPTSGNCSGTTTFTTSAPTPITSGVAPFIGSYIPEGDFAAFNNGGSAIGCWILEVCDLVPGDIGTLHYANLVFAGLPSCTNLTSPANGAANVAVTAALTWAASTGSPAGYRLTVGTTPGGSNILNNFDVGNVTTYNPPGNFPYNTTIYVKIIPYNANGSPESCTTQSFTTQISPPNCTSLTSPANGSLGVPVLTSLLWPAATGNPAGYLLNVGTTSGGTNILNNFNVGNNTSYTFQNPLPYNTIIYVKIIPYNAGGNATGCSEQSFTTLVLQSAPSCTNLTLPANGAANIPVNTVLVWAAAGGNPTGYRLDAGTTPGGTNILNNVDVGNVTTYDPPGYLPYGATIYVTIKPYNGGGLASGCSMQSFSTGNCIPNLNIVAIPVPTGTYKSLGDLISSNSTVTTGTVVTFTSDTGVLLNQNFVVEQGGIFEIKLQGCTTASPADGPGSDDERY